MLSDKKYEKILSCLEQGISQQEIASSVKVSTRTVWKIASGRYSRKANREGIEPPIFVKTEPVRCRVCGSLIVLSPCPACHVRILQKPGSPVCVENAPLGVDLHGEEKRRYLEVRHKVETEIAAGKRSALSAISDSR